MLILKIFLIFAILGTYLVHDFVCLFKDYLVDYSNSDLSSEGRLKITKWYFGVEKVQNLNYSLVNDSSV